MRYLILNGTPYHVSYPADFYRGTDRRRPVYCDSLPRDHEVNRLFEWYLNETYGGFIQDLDTARRYAALCNRYFPSQRFEIVEACQGNEKASNSDGKFLGFDISAGGGGDSLIFLALLAGPSAAVPEGSVLLLSDLICRHFHPRLNEFGLFSSFEDASYCRRAMIALQSLHPNLYEGGDLEVFLVTGIYLIPESNDK